MNQDGILKYSNSLRKTVDNVELDIYSANLQVSIRWVAKDPQRTLLVTFVGWSEMFIVSLPKTRKYLHFLRLTLSNMSLQLIGVLIGQQSNLLRWRLKETTTNKYLGTLHGSYLKKIHQNKTLGIHRNLRTLRNGHLNIKYNSTDVVLSGIKNERISKLNHFFIWISYLVRTYLFCVG